MDGDRPTQKPHNQADWDGRDGRDDVGGGLSAEAHANGYRLCKLHGKTTVAREAHGITYLNCGCHAQPVAS